MAKKKKDDIPILVVPKNATLRQIYAIIKKKFTAADLQKYTVDEPMVPFEGTLAEMEKIHLEESAKVQRQSMRKRRRK